MVCRKSKFFLSCLFLFRLQVGIPKSRQPVVKGGKDGAEVRSLPFKNTGPFYCGAFLFLSCLIKYISIYSYLSGLPASRMKATFRNQAEDPAHGAASTEDIIKMHG